MASNETLQQIVQLFNLNISDISNTSVVSEEQLFDLYEAYTNYEREQLIIYKFVAYVIGTLIILSNIVVVISSGLILRKGQQPKSTYLLLGNVSLADTIIGVSLIFGTVVDDTLSSSTLCIFQIGMIVCPTLVSIFSVGLIAIDRYIYILHGLYYQRWINTTRVRICIVFTWLVGMFVASLPAFGWTGHSFRNFRCWYIAVFPASLLIILSIIALTIILMVCVLYFTILHRAVKTVDEIIAFKESQLGPGSVNKGFESDSKEFDEITKTVFTITVATETITKRDFDDFELVDINNSPKMQWREEVKKGMYKITSYCKKARAVHAHPSKLKAVKMVLLATACFVGTWAPYYVAIILYVKCDILVHGYQCVPLEILTLGPLYLLGVTNSLCDPLIYAWWHAGFKHSIIKIYCKYIWNIKILRHRKC